MNCDTLVSSEACMYIEFTYANLFPFKYAKLKDIGI